MELVTATTSKLLETVACVRKFNIERHYTTRHREKYSKYKSEEREQLVMKLKAAFFEKIRKEAHSAPSECYMPVPVVIKIEDDSEEPIQTMLPETPTTESKCESPVDVKLETEVVSNIPSEEVDATNGYYPSNNSYLESTAYEQHELVDSFVIYELESAATTTTTTNTNVVPTTSPHTAFAKPPPTLLNAKFRKRARGETAAVPEMQQNPTVVTNASSSALYTSTPLPQVAPAAGVAVELKVKCFCRLRNPTDNATPSNGEELKNFYEQMFAETRQLTQEQQRSVKMALLEAICQAEDDVEAGRFCEKCCS